MMQKIYEGRRNINDKLRNVADRGRILSEELIHLVAFPPLFLDFDGEGTIFLEPVRASNLRVV